MKKLMGIAIASAAAITEMLLMLLMFNNFSFLEFTNAIIQGKIWHDFLKAIIPCFLVFIGILDELNEKWCFDRL